MLTITTCQTYPNPPQNLLPLQQQLNAIGIPTAFEPWQETTNAANILPLCAWDYTLFYDDFIRWIKQHSPHFINPAELMIWNSHKRYLCDLQQWGVKVIPTMICPVNSSEILTALQAKNWQEYVIKPAIGQSGNLVTKLKAGDPLPDLTGYGNEVVLQPFIPEVAIHGETSLIFFNGNFSHAIRRQPPKNEWRSNSQYKVEIFPETVSDSVIQTVKSILKKLPIMPKYARVDGTIINGELLLNELELIEPALYLDRADGATERFVEMLRECINR